MQSNRLTKYDLILGALGLLCLALAHRWCSP
jgi:hypothetical protein